VDPELPPLVAQLLAAFGGDEEALNAIFDEDVVVRTSGSLLPALPQGAEGLQILLSFLRTPFPDLAFAETRPAAGQGSIAVVAWVATGTHAGPGLFNLAPTGRRIRLAGQFMIRGSALIDRLWVSANLEQLLPDLGMAPSPPP
jgi:hypothetical protein